MRAQRGFEARMIRLERGVRRKKWRRRSGERGFRGLFGGTRVGVDDLVQLDSRAMIKSKLQSSEQNGWEVLLTGNQEFVFVRIEA